VDAKSSSRNRAYGTGCLAAVTGDAEHTVILAAAAEALLESIGEKLLPADRVPLGRWLPIARQSLGEAAPTVWMKGQALSFGQAVALAGECVES
jgi:hypothetical protein